MRRFVTELLVFFLVQACIAYVVLRACPRRPDHYAAASIDKRERLQTAPSPRIVLVGDSAIAFGVDSRMFEPWGYAPVNMGHNRSLGLAFMLAQVEDELRPGDVVVVSPAYSLLWTDGVDETLITHLEYDPYCFRHVDVDVSRRLLDHGLVWAARKLRCAVHGLHTQAPIQYSRWAFDERGDFVAHRGAAPSEDMALPVRWPPRVPDLSEALELLDRFHAHCEAADALCFFAFPPLRAEAHAEAEALVAAIEAEIATRCPLPIVLRAVDAVYSSTAFLDAGTHLTGEGARVHTRRLMAGLASALGRS